MAQTTVEGIEGVQGLVGQHLGYSDWVEITQEQVNQFAEATGDHQWIHVDVERAKREMPGGKTIAHGYLTLSLAPMLMEQVLTLKGVSMGVNYGCNKVRFMAPVPIGSKLRLGVKMLAVDEIAGGSQMTIEATLEVEGASKPSCVAEVIYRQYE